jgi:hypothetical protein
MNSRLGIFFSKDRREEVIEVEEESESVHVPDVNERAKLMTQGQWMKGCPEGGEQSFLFGLYSELSEGECACPHGCGTSLPRKKRDFFAIFVSPLSSGTHPITPPRLMWRRTSLAPIPRISKRPYRVRAKNAENTFVLRVESRWR